MQFNNRINECTKTADGRTIWLSRSIAVVGVVVVIQDDGQGYILMNKRGPGCPDEIGKWVLPCGYLDWDESCEDACRREIWEETDLDVTSLYESALFNSFEVNQPFHVKSKPSSDKKQNVSMYYGLVANVKELPVISSINCEPGEVDELAWVKVQDFDELDIGFSHRDIVGYFFDNVWTD